MSWRVVVVSSRAKLELKLGYLVVRGTEVRRVLLDEISVLLIENTGCVISVALMEALWEHKIDVVFCDSHHFPSALLVSLNGNYETSARLSVQMAWTKEAKEAVWSAIIKEKINKQAHALRIVGNIDAANQVNQYAENIQSGDSTNREAHAAKVYFNAIMGHTFSRKESSRINEALNYGYTLILSAVCRVIVSAGYMTQLGIFHHSVFNQFNLGSDIMEPFRPLVDMKALSLPIGEELSPESKRILVEVLNDPVMVNGSKTTVLSAIETYTRSVLDALANNDVSRITFYDYCEG